MANYKELLERRVALEAEIESARANEVGAAIAKIQELMAQYGLTPEDIAIKRRG